MKEKRKSTTATPSKILSRVSSTHLSKENNTSKSRKTINSITSTRNSSTSATVLPRLSINNESRTKKPTQNHAFINCCSKNCMKNLEEWKTSFQLKLDSLLEKLDQIEKINDYISKMFPVYKHNHLLTLN